MSTAPASSSSDMRSFFGNRFVQAILLSGLFVQIGIWVRNFAVLLFVTEQTHNNSNAVSLIYFAEFAPIFLFSFIGGTFADRWRPKRTMVWCDLLSALSVFMVLLALVFGSWQVIFFVTLVSSILSQFSQPSGMKLFKLHVPESQMQLGMSMYQSMIALFMIFGPILGTFVYYHFGINTGIAIMGVCFVLSAVVLVFLPPDREGEEKEPTRFWADMGEGLRYVRSSKMLTTLGGCFTAAGLGVGLITPMGVFIVTESFSLSAEHLKWFTSVNGAAMIVGGVLAMGLAKKITPQGMLTVGMVVSAVSVALMGNTSWLWLALTAQFFSGIVMPAIQIGISTMILGNTKEAFVGRVNGILNPLFMGTMVFMMLAAGWLKDTFSLGAVYWMSGALFFIGVLIMLPILKLKPELEKITEPSV
ncbi:MFS transporter [Paenibacillus athensensis]|uniref:MFS transporter n=1 Tax=Paenibacillus athensensis TaxID=1967502 RepID=A0A4Y8Q0M4_9BACL|nr:MFS transporter [Paenibacillus athensensis]MCD1258308.1 MFS transporter [Paenibacillus athensensis]